MGEEKFQKMIKEATVHIDWCVELYRMQAEQGGYFLHEHPSGATSWKLRSIKDLMFEKNVEVVEADMCMFGMTTNVKGKEMAAKKPTKFMSNSPEIVRELARKCRGEHEHGWLVGGARTKKAAIYPKGLCDAVCRGFKMQIDADGIKRRKVQEAILSAIDGANEIDVDQILSMANGEFIDDVKGGKLNANEVEKARREEMGYLLKHKVYTKTSRQECIEKTGKQPIRVRWVDTVKAGGQHRSRLVAMQFKDGDRPDLFVPTPAIESVRLLISKAARRRHSVMVADVRRAYFYAKARQTLYVELPDEDKRPGEDGMVGRLNMSLYGTRDAARNWEEELNETFEALGFQKGRAAPCSYLHKVRDIAVVVHGDDIVSTGEDGQLEWLNKKIKAKYEVREQWLAKVGDKVNVLNKTIEMTAAGFEIEADERHAAMIISDMGVTKPISTTLPKEAEHGEEVVDHDAGPPS